MAKRRLTKQQSRRIEQNITNRQQQNQSLHEKSLGPEQAGLIISHHGKTLIVENTDGNRFRCSSRQNIGQVVCGDHVVWQAINEQEGVITAIKDRQSLLVRPGFADRIKPVAANITLICIVIAPEPAPQEDLIDRYLVAAEYLKIKPVILCNKSDLLDTESTNAWQKRFSVYKDIGYELLTTSTKQEHGLDQLYDILKGNSSILVGQSGVGKSSLINCLIPDKAIKVKVLSEQITQGQHTTSHSELHHLPNNGGDLIDSPGVRDFRLGHLDRHTIEQGFTEFRPFIGQCRFSDCKHINEPECAILAAVADGKIQPQRLESYQAIVA
jgi:ribosome biogenesis GTPase